MRMLSVQTAFNWLKFPASLLVFFWKTKIKQLIKLIYKTFMLTTYC